MTTNRTLTGLLAVALLAIALPLAAAEKPDASAGGIRWHGYDEGLALAKESGKPLLVSFHADWCKFCKKMERETYTDARVVALINEQFIPVSVDTDHEKETAARYGVQSLPTVWFLQSDGQPIDYLPGFVDADFFTKVLDYLASGSYASMSFQQYLEDQAS